MSSPGKETASAIRALLAPLGHRLKVALAAACSERVLPVIAPFVSSELPTTALALAWRFAEGGAVTDDEVAALAAKYDRLINELYDREETDFVLTACFAPYYAAKSVADEVSAERAIFEASDAAETDSPRTLRDAHVEEELGWQLRAAEFVARLQSPTAERTLLDEIASTPTWLVEFRRRLPAR